jgi:hypothetical protein
MTIPSAFHRAFVALAALLVCARACAVDAPDAVFDRYVAAVHAGDMAAVRALISPEVERSDFVGCRPEMDNPACLAHYIHTTVVQPQAQLTVVRRQVEGPLVTADLEVRSPLYAREGVARIVGKDLVWVRDGLIHGFRFVPDFNDGPTADFFGTRGIGPRASQTPSK